MFRYIGLDRFQTLRHNSDSRIDLARGHRRGDCELASGRAEYAPVHHLHVQKFRQGAGGLLRGDSVPRRSNLAFTPVDGDDRSQTGGARPYACRLKCPVEPVFQPLAQFVDGGHLFGRIRLHRRHARRPW